MANRPTLMGTRQMVSAGHYLAAQAGQSVLEAGGNAIDAGVAAGMALGVVQSELVNVAGVAPIMIRLAETGEIITISGLGTWPEKATLEHFETVHGGHIPHGIERTVVPAAPAAWIAALARYGTMRFADVAQYAARFASDGIVMYPLMAENLAAHEADYKRYASNAAIYMPTGRPPEVGELFVQADLGASLKYMMDQEATAKGDRLAGLRAARDAFYKGDLARRITAHHEANGGFLTMKDLAEFDVAIEPPVRARYGNATLYLCGPWCQGPVLGQMLGIIDGIDLTPLGHNSPAYIHLLVEAMKVAYADREAYYGDPRFQDVPMQALLDPAYAAERRKLIDPNRAAPSMPEPGRPGGAHPWRGTPAGVPLDGRAAASPPLDTSYVCVVDDAGNAFSATPSDVSYDTEVIPGTGLCPSSRGSQSWAVRGHPSALAPGKRPRLTPNPAILTHDDGRVMPFGTPGGDVQSQAMLQVMLNMDVWGMPLQDAIEAPRFATYSYPDSFEPHGDNPGLMRVEGLIDQPVRDALSDLGHRVEAWPDMTWKAGGICAVELDPKTGVRRGGADPRRAAYAVGW